MSLQRPVTVNGDSTMRHIIQSPVIFLLLGSMLLCGNIYAQSTRLQGAEEDIKPSPLILPMAPEIPRDSSVPIDLTDQKIEPIQVEPSAAKPVAAPEYKKAKKEQSQDSE